MWRRIAVALSSSSPATARDSPAEIRLTITTLTCRSALVSVCRTFP
jgi:hypothetical protein